MEEDYGGAERGCLGCRVKLVCGDNNVSLPDEVVHAELHRGDSEESEAVGQN